MDRLADLGHLSSSAWERLQELLDRFEKAWNRLADPNGAVELSDYLPKPNDPMRSVAFQELIKTDLEQRWKRGQTIGLEFYLNKYSELGTSHNLSPKLIFEEYRIRQQIGDKLPIHLYERRFPQQYRELQKLVEHQQADAARTPSVQGAGQGQPPASAPPPPSAPMSFAEGMTVGNYILGKRLGDGGFGEVWRAKAQGGIEVAVKIGFRTMEKEESKRELQSLELTKQLRHPYLLQNHAFWEQGGKLFIAMELADGNLRDRLKQCRQEGLTGIPVGELIKYFLQVGEALDYLHKRGILHRDIKPDNILLLEGFAKVADFGLARSMGANHSMSVSGSGTPAYMAPEMFGSKVNATTDQYCLAVTYAELRLDRRLFPGKDLMELMMQHVSAIPKLDPLPPAEQEVLLKALAKKSENRYPTCAEFVRDLEAAMVQEGVMVGGGRHGGADTGYPSQANTPSKTSQSPSRRAKTPVVADNDPYSRTISGVDFESEGRDTPPSTNMITAAGTPYSLPPQSGFPGTTQSGRPSSWKGTQPAEGRKRRFGLIAGLFTVAALVAAGAAVFIAKGSLEGKVKPLIDKGEFQEALKEIDNAGFLASFFQSGLRDQVLSGWRARVQVYFEQKNYKKTEEEVRALLTSFPDDSKATEMLTRAISENVKELVKDGDFPKAFERVLTAKIDAGAKDILARDLRDRAIAAAKAALVAKKHVTAVQIAREVDKHFPGDKEAGEILNDPSNIKTKIQDLIKEGQFEKAIVLVKNESKTLGPENVNQFREEILQGWLKKAETYFDARELVKADDTWEIIKEQLEGEEVRVKVEAHKAATKSGDFRKKIDEIKKLIAAKKYGDALKRLNDIQPPAGQKDTIISLATEAKTALATMLLDQADALVKNDITACLRTLSEVGKLSDGVGTLNADLYARWKEQYSLALAMDPKSTPKDHSKAIRLFNELSGTPKRLPELVRAFLKLVNEENKDEVNALLRTAQAKLGKGNLKELDAYLIKNGISAQKQKFELAMKEAEEAFDKNELPLSRSKLDTAKENLDDTDSKNKEKYQALDALLLARGPKSKHDEAAKSFESLLKKEGAYRAGQLCEAFVKLAENDPKNFLERALASIGPVLKTLEKKDKEQVNLLYRSLIENAVPELGPGAELKKLLPALESAPNAWALACQAECLIEQNDKPAAADIEKARAAVQKAIQAKETGYYAHYVEALVNFASTPQDLKAVGQSLLAAFPAGEELPKWKPHRKDRVVKMGLAAAKQLRSGVKPNAPFKTAADAGIAYQLLIAVRTYAPAEDIRLPLALAALYKTKPDLRIADTLTKALKKDAGFAMLGPDAYSLLLGQAKAMKGQMGALEAYLEILKLNGKKPFLKVEGNPELAREYYKGLHDLVLTPALSLVEKGIDGKSLKKEEARLRADLAWLLLGHPKEFDDAFPQALAEITKAIVLDKKAEYYIKRASIRLQVSMAPPNKFTVSIMKQMEEDCAKAVNLVKSGKDKYFVAHSFHGYLLVMRAKMAKNPSEQKKLLIEARDEYQTALDLAKGQDDEKAEKPAIHHNRIDLSLRLAALEKDPKKREMYLDAAKKDADGAVELDTHPSIHKYYHLYGIVREARSWTLGINEYAEAVDAYKLAIEKADAFKLASDKKELPVFRIGLIRASVKLVKLGGGKKEFLADAVKAYQLAMEGTPLPNKLEKVTLNYWIAWAYWLQENYAEATKKFEEAVALAKDEMSQGFQTLSRDALNDLIEMDLTQGAKLLEAEESDKTGLALLVSARKLAKDLKELDAASAARLIGRSWELGEKKNPEKAIQIYEKALDAAKNAKKPDARLFARRLTLLADPKYLLKFKKLPSFDLLPELAETAKKLAADPDQLDPWIKASLNASAGLALFASDRTKNRAEAIGLLNKAQTDATLNHPDRAYWTKKLADLNK